MLDYLYKSFFKYSQNQNGYFLLFLYYFKVHFYLETQDDHLSGAIVNNAFP